jgi:Tfp pilus assembly protein PilN
MVVKMKREINLLPINLPENKKILLNKNGLTIVWGVVLVILLGCYVGLIFLDESCLNQIEAMETEEKNSDGNEIARESLSDHNDAANQRESLIKEVSINKNVPVQALLEIQKVLPLTMNITDLTFSKNMISIAAETKKREDILVFKEKLSQCALFDQIQIISCEKMTAGNMENRNLVAEDCWGFTLEIKEIKVDKNEQKSN